MSKSTPKGSEGSTSSAELRKFLGISGCSSTCSMNEDEVQTPAPESIKQVQPTPEKRKTTSYNSDEMVEVLTMIKAGQIKKVFAVIKEKDNITMLDVIRVLVAKDRSDMIPRLIEMASLQGYLKL